MSQVAISRRRDGFTAFSEHLLKHLFVEGEICHQSLQSAILAFKLAQSTKLCDACAAKFLLPNIEGCCTDAELPARLSYRGAVVNLSDRKCNLFITEFRFPHYLLLPLTRRSKQPSSSLQVSSF